VGRDICREHLPAVTENFQPIAPYEADGVRCDLPDDEVTGAAQCRYSPGAEYIGEQPKQIALFHYVTKSWEDFEVKMVRGDGNSDDPSKAKSAPYFLSIQSYEPLLDTTLMHPKRTDSPALISQCLPAWMHVVCALLLSLTASLAVGILV
jgi:hypothetical protein